MKKIAFILLFCIFLSILYAAQTSYDSKVISITFELNTSSDEARLLNLSIEERDGDSGQFLDYKNTYSIFALGKERNVLREIRFYRPFFGKSISHYGSNSGDITDKGQVTEYINYYPEAKYLLMKNNNDNKTIFEIDLQGKFCNSNNVCEPPNENYLSCPQDCKAADKDDYCTKISGDGVCDPDCSYLWDKDCPKDFTENFTPDSIILITPKGTARSEQPQQIVKIMDYLPYLIGLVVAIAIILYFIISKKKNNEA